MRCICMCVYSIQWKELLGRGIVPNNKSDDYVHVLSMAKCVGQNSNLYAKNSNIVYKVYRLNGRILLVYTGHY